jgi:hypothetical protein
MNEPDNVLFSGTLLAAFGVYVSRSMDVSSGESIGPENKA